MKSTEKSFLQKLKVRFYIPVAIIILISTTLLYSFCKRSEKNDVIMQMVMQFAERYHFSPPKIDDQFSQKVFDAYLKQLDPFKWFLTKEDVKQMEVYKLQIDDQIRNNTFELYSLATSLLDKRVAETQNYYKEFLAQPFDFTSNETMEADPEKLDWAANEPELKERWRKEVKYRVLVQVSNMMKAQKKDSVSKTFEVMEKEARQQEMKTFADRFTYYNQQNPEDKFSGYVNAVMAVFDPHTRYNTPTAKDKFDIEMTGQLEGIGATLQTSDGYVKVVHIVPGSPSWHQGELKVNDLIMKVKQENEAVPVDIFGMRIDDAVKLIRGKKGTKVTLTVKKNSDGTIHDITITRDLVIIEETYAKSAVLTDPATKAKVGYIYLPAFYVDFKRTPTGRAASEDVAKEIEKLKNEKVQGIILDLRYNGGGSLPDAIRMGGLFIESGPIVQVKANIGLPRAYDDPDPAVQYEGPLVVLTSSVSASASEIFAAAMQDYKRAVIIGGPSTFGKGTVQEIFDLDDYLSMNFSKVKPLGSLFLTIQKFYRVNGGSTQLKGVSSDIVLPDVYSEWKVGERFEDNCMPWTTVDAAKYTVWKNPVPVAMLQKNSKERTSKSEVFKLLSEQIGIMKKQRDKTQLSLNLKTFQQDEEKRRLEGKRFEEVSQQPTQLNVAAMAVDIAAEEGDTAKIALLDKWVKGLNKDIYLEEAVKVIGDIK